MLAQDHDGLLELDEVDASKAVASSSRAAMDPADDLRLSVFDRTGPVTRVVPRGVDSPPSTSLCVPSRTPLNMATLIWTFWHEMRHRRVGPCSL